MEALFYDLSSRYEKLSRQGDPLESLNELIPWEYFRKQIEKQLNREAKNPLGGRPAYDAVLMFKILVLQSLFNLSDDQIEFQVRDRLSFMRFLGLSFGDSVPDAKTVWLFREHMKDGEMIKRLFNKFQRYLDKKGYKAKKGQIVDASIVTVPIQRNSSDENKKIKEGKCPKKWKKDKSKLHQKDLDARWVKKHGKSYYGYKNHISVDQKSKLVRGYEVTDASVHDSQPFYNVLAPNNSSANVWGDSAYRSGEIEQDLKQAGYKSKIMHKGVRGKPLSKAKIKINSGRSSVRVIVEHVFGFQENSMGGKFIRTIGSARAEVKIGMQNLVYNMKRFCYLHTRNLSTP